MPTNKALLSHRGLFDAVETYFNALYYCDLELFDQVFIRHQVCLMQIRTM